MLLDLERLCNLCKVIPPINNRAEVNQMMDWCEKLTSLRF